MVLILSLRAGTNWSNDVERWLVLSPFSLYRDKRLSVDRVDKGAQVTSWLSETRSPKTPQL